MNLVLKHLQKHFVRVGPLNLSNDVFGINSAMDFAHPSSPLTSTWIASPFDGTTPLIVVTKTSEFVYTNSFVDIMSDIAMSTLTRAPGPSPTKALSLPSGSPRSSPPASPTSTRGPRSVSWSLPSPRNSVSINLPPLALRYPSMDIEARRNNPSEYPGSPEYIAWRNFHLSKAKLSGITEIAAVMAGFSVVATVELQINEDANPYLLTAFSVVTALLVATTMMAIMISTCILPHIQVVAKMHPDIDLSESPHEKLQWYIDISWVLANSVSIFLFTLDVVILCWVKFTYFSEAASWCATLIMAPVLVILCIFGIVFYRNIIKHQSQVSERKYQELEQLKRQLECSEIQHV